MWYIIVHIPFGELIFVRHVYEIATCESSLLGNFCKNQSNSKVQHERGLSTWNIWFYENAAQATGAAVRNFEM